MSDLINKVKNTFEEIKLSDSWKEIWSARDLMKALWYSEWRTFEQVIEKAIQSCKNSSNEPRNHFVADYKMVRLWSWSQRQVNNYKLTRYACYLIAQNWNSRLPQIALAQTYFASQTRKQEINDKIIEENKRLEARWKLKISEWKIERTVYQRWINLPQEFANFKNKKIETLYKTSTKELKKKRWIPNSRALADFDNEVELKAKDFIYAMTDHNIKEKELFWKQKLEWELVSNAKETRKAMIARWIIPEKLKPQEDLKLVEKRRKKEQEIGAKNNQKLK